MEKLEFDQGLAFGKALFETIKIVDKRPLFLDYHIERLKESLAFLAIENSLENEEVFDYIEKEKAKDYALKVIVSDKNKLFIKRDDPYINLPKDKKTKACFSEVLRNSTSKLVRHKTVAYFENIIEKRKAKEEGYDEVIFLNEKGQVAEGAIANIFFIKGGKIYTPSMSSGILNGTMRRYIIEKFAATEKDICLSDLAYMDSAFLSNSLMGVLELESLGDFSFKSSYKFLEIRQELERLGF